jgi:hemolysin activation/secretion protein
MDKYYKPFGFGALCLWSVLSNAQNIPEGEAERQLIRQQEQRQQQEQLLKEAVDVRLDSPSFPTSAIMFPIDESPCFTINEIKLVGERLPEFSWLLDQFYLSFSKEMKNELGGEYESAYALLDASKNYFLGRCMGSTSINNVMTRLQNQLIEKGYVTSRIVAGSQELSTGVLVLTLVPGVVGDIRFSDQKKRANVLPMNSSDLLSLRDIEQALESMRRLPSVTADINIVPAQGENAQPGDSDLDIVWSQDFPLRTVLSINNSGTESTGELQGSASFSYDNLFGLHDITTLSVGHDIGGATPLKGGTDSLSVGYSVPYEYWTISLNASKGGYFQTIQGQFIKSEYSGKSRNANLDITRLVHRDNVRKITLGLNTWYRDSKNFIRDTEVLPQRRRTAGIELKANYRQFIQQATLSGSLTYRRGTGAFGALAAPEDAFGEGASRPSIIKASAQFSVPFTLAKQRFQYSAEWRRQHTRERLVTQDRFSIGGRYTVRGFDGESTLLSETGWLVRNDLSMSLGDSSHDVYLGVDYGKVSGFSSASLLGDELTGAVIGFKGTFFDSLSYDLLAGRSLNKPEGFPTDSGVVQFSLNWAY